MARHVNWYMDGWEYKEDKQGGMKRTLVYTGPYYSFNLSERGLLKLKAGYLMLTLALFCVFLLCATRDSGGGKAFYSGVPTMFATVPFMYLGMGVACLLPAKSSMTYRSYYASVKRITYSTRFAIALLGLGTLGRVVYIALNLSGGMLDLRLELLCLLGEVFCLADIAVMFYLLRRFPVIIIQKTNK